jgi:hypothetical protein|tara:strand:- start:43 stop:429 length:387 start_codon:yes stop_codon:yes gene_type:complete
MRKFFYFRDVANEDADDDISASVAIPVDAIAGIVPVAITTLELYLNKKGVVNNQKVTLTVTRGKLKEVMHELVSYANGYTHNKAPLTVMGDMATTTHNAASIEGDDVTKSTVFFSNDVTAVAIGQAGY